MMGVKSTRSTVFLLIVGLTCVAAGCGAKKDIVPQGATEPDKFLYDKGKESLENHRWMSAREYFRRILDTYPQSNLRPDAKLGVADCAYQSVEDTGGSLGLVGVEQPGHAGNDERDACGSQGIDEGRGGVLDAPQQDGDV